MPLITPPKSLDRSPLRILPLPFCFKCYSLLRLQASGAEWRGDHDDRRISQVGGALTPAAKRCTVIAFRNGMGVGKWNQCDYGLLPVDAALSRACWVAALTMVA